MQWAFETSQSPGQVKWALHFYDDAGVFEERIRINVRLSAPEVRMLSSIVAMRLRHAELPKSVMVEEIVQKHEILPAGDTHDVMRDRQHRRRGTYWSRYETCIPRNPRHL